jgi:hypothetical protein
MSWIFGFSGSLSEQRKLSLSSIFPVPQVKIDEHRLFIAAGGPDHTFNFSPENRWLTLGIGIGGSGENRKLMMKDDWDGVISREDFKNPEGHYVIIKWDNEKINFYSDPIGLRTIYFYKHKEGIYFSSSLEWITAVMEKIEIDFTEFGSRWMAFNQFSNNSFIYNIEKLPPASSAIITRGMLKIESENWLPEIKSSEPENLFSNLRGLLSVEIPDNVKMTFGLSGGLDSRFLLSFLLQDRNQKYNIHSFGYNDDADLQVAKKITEELALKCYFLHPREPGSGHFFNRAGEYAGAVQLAEPVSSYIKLAVLNDKYFENKFLIDGALAEFARRQFLNRLLIKGKGALQSKNHKEVLKHLLVPKPKIFKVEIEEMMLENAEEQLRTIFESFPDPGEIGIENFVDLLIVKYRIPNYFGPEQSRLDNILPGFMPFAQRSTITASLGIPVKQRKDSQLFYNAIHNNYPALEDYPLVKNSTVYPYGLSSLTSYAYTHLKKAIRKNPQEESLCGLFRMHEKTIREIITRDAVREYKPYDEEAVMSILNDFYGSRKASASDLNWLLTFEMFRKKLSITGL